MTEILSTTVKHYQLDLIINLERVSASGYSIYDLEPLVDGQPTYQLWNTVSTYDAILLTRKGLSLLEPWCQAHPNSYLTMFGAESAMMRSLIQWGAACDGRADSWFTFIDRHGQRALFPGVLNPIADCLDICDLWRVAKDFDYFLGEYQSIKDRLAAAFDEAGYRNLLEEGYGFTLDLTALYQQYRDFFEQHQVLRLSYPHHPLDNTYPLNVIHFQPEGEPLENQAFRFYVGSRLVAALQPNNLIIFSSAFPKQLKSVAPSTEVFQAYLDEIATQILALDPTTEEVTYS
jgi:hypothetical protein